MAELVLILKDFFSVPATAGGALLPRLPLLETVCARAARAPLSGDWRGWMAAHCGGASALESTLAATVAAAWQVRLPEARADAQYWLATPVHYFAGLDSVHLHPAGVLQLGAEEQALLVADFARVFADSGWVLMNLGQRELLLSGPNIDANGADPARFVGCDPTPGLPRGAAGGTLRRLGTEIEMWLHEHPLNQQRHSRGQLPVSTLWFWGAQQPSVARARVRAPLRVYGSDTYAGGLMRLQGRVLEPLPQAFDATLIDPQCHSVFILPTLQEDGLAQTLMRFERHWLTGAFAALRARRATALQLLVGARTYRLRRLDLARFWRTLTPWWEQLN